ncbi:LysR family transcriptional regulator [Dactylosporangium matsuzakiense]|uniref:LysR family transcriptional regulator n=1 Tax=Dactylosporangium matsuzakiense TaxID=53360 RepID=A0A9W6NPB2_9ACTN|nr:LysR substrate-binding domain-containing protein [Dactylosporangium matsuzakiense]UWZ43577.1 LysR family transcriptional regulator [Dactylosporangium matsuzakiense]GLL04091.1 LysR family transcriptional regulator [Dactylosporangium matsuzakiense]
MERHELETFLVLAEELHFGRAAIRLGRTTARVSQIIRVLERRIGAPLFDRTSRRVALTPAGRRLYEDLRPAYAQITAAIARAVAAARGVTGVLRVGFVGALSGRLAIEAAERFRHRHAGSDVQLRELQSGAATEGLLADEVDVLIACFPIDAPDLTSGAPLFSEPRMLAVATHHPFAARPSVSVTDLAHSRMVAAPCSLPDTIPAGAAAAAANPNGAATNGAALNGVGGVTRSSPEGPVAETFQEALTLVGAGQGAFVVGEHAIRFYPRPDITYVPLRDAPPLHWGPVWPTTRATARVRAFLAAAAAP